ncbi:MAG: hypothetical protein JWN46_2705, partial [Acidimicrobiales bacterium]|nr:hypothetical protein [Acidimicrobiales bacterium]
MATDTLPRVASAQVTGLLALAGPLGLEVAFGPAPADTHARALLVVLGAGLGGAAALGPADAARLSA